MRVHSSPTLNGGASDFGYTIIDTVSALGIRARRAFDFCSGYGGVGYRLLDRGLCDHLVLGDINPEALDLARGTIIENDLRNVTIYETDCLDQIPDHELWDLVVSNPPHFPESDLVSLWENRPETRDVPLEYFHERIWSDPDWTIHKRFFESVGDHLTPDGTIVICENGIGATPGDFDQMIRDNGFSYEVRRQISWDPFFVLVIRRA
jgi:methylase of polypeptide subunit release factors